jgi:zinc protease
MSRRWAAAVGGLGLVLIAVGLLTAAQEWPRSTRPAPLPDRPVAFPPYQIKTLPNGLTVLVVLHHEQPSISFRLIVRAGAMQEPDDKPGVASFVASLLDQGTETKSAGQIATLIESAGGILGTGSGNELSHVSGAVIKDQTDMLLALAAEMVQRPAFAPAEIDRQRQQVVSSLRVSNDDPDFIANAVFDRLVFGAHPYGRPNGGTAESITRLTRADLTAFHGTWFVPNNALLAIVGDLTADEAFAAATKAFGSWARREVPEVKAVSPPAPARRLVVIDRPDSAQTEIRVGHVAVPRTHVDYLPLEIAIRILGGEGANRLFGVLRSDRGLTYGASADLHAFKAAGQIVAETDTRSEATGDALRLTVEEFWRLQRERVDPRELGGAQDYVAGNFPLSIETPGAIAEQVLSQLFYGLDPKELETYRDRVRAVTPQEIQRVAREYVKPEQLAIVLVGNASAFLEQIKALGFTDVERIPLAQLDLNSPTLRRSGAADRGLPVAVPTVR